MTPNGSLPYTWTSKSTLADIYIVVDTVRHSNSVKAHLIFFTNLIPSINLKFHWPYLITILLYYVLLLPFPNTIPPTYLPFSHFPHTPPLTPLLPFNQHYIHSSHNYSYHIQSFITTHLSFFTIFAHFHPHSLFHHSILSSSHHLR